MNGVALDPDVAIAVLNQLALVAFVTLLGAGLFGLLRRLRLYFAAEQPVPVIMKRDVALLGALALIGLEAMALRSLNLVLDGWPRFVYVAQTDIILFAAVLYWVKIELFDIDDPEVK